MHPMCLFGCRASHIRPIVIYGMPDDIGVTHPIGCVANSTCKVHVVKDVITNDEVRICWH